MPLSEDEQRILQEIERSFYENDPAFYGKVSSETLYRHAGRNCKWAMLGFLAGLAVLIVSFASSILLGFLGFLIMLSCAIVFESNARKMGRAGLAQIAGSVKGKGVAEALTDTRRKLRERFKRGEQ
ncbi:MAG TPA: DUF3040 domain-containing protein [Acidimicrobiales bacterium]|nr:DUF3040 domain-containing protein [Acidimicrobiales bacterium]